MPLAIKKISKYIENDKIRLEALKDYHDLVIDGTLREGYCPFSYRFPNTFGSLCNLQCDLFCYYHFPELKEKDVCPCKGECRDKVKELVNTLINGRRE